MKQVEIIEPASLQTEYLLGVNRLLCQLSATANPMSSEQFKKLLSSTTSHFYIAKDGDIVLGMCTLAIYDAPTGRKAWIEDVVVDSDARGMGLGRKLVNHAIQQAHRYAPVTLMLTSRPSRIAANKLYQDMGFENKETNVYKKVLI